MHRGEKEKMKRSGRRNSREEREEVKKWKAKIEWWRLEEEEKN